MAYTAAVTKRDMVGQKLAGTPLRLTRGSVSVSSYHATLAEITGITQDFRDTPNVILGGVSSNGYLVAWVAASKAIKAFYPSVVQTHGHDFLVKGGQAAASTDALSLKTTVLGKESATDSTQTEAEAVTGGGVQSRALAAAAGTEVANDVDIGSVEFIAIGIAP